MSRRINDHDAVRAERERIARIEACGRQFAKLEGLAHLDAEAKRDGWNHNRFFEAVCERFASGTATLRDFALTPREKK